MKRKAEVDIPTEAIELRRAPITIRGYTDDELVCTLVISGAGIAVYPRNSHKPLYDLNWEKFVKLLKDAESTH